MFEFGADGRILTELVIVVLVEAGFVSVGEGAGVAVAVLTMVAESKSELCQTRRTPNAMLNTEFGKFPNAPVGSVKVVIPY